MEILLSETPDISHYVFSGVYVMPILAPLINFNSHSRCIFWVILLEKRGWCLYDHDTQQFFVSRDVHFFESQFPFAPSISGPFSSNSCQNTSPINSLVEDFLGPPSTSSLPNPSHTTFSLDSSLSPSVLPSPSLDSAAPGPTPTSTHIPCSSPINSPSSPTPIVGLPSSHTHLDSHTLSSNTSSLHSPFSSNIIHPGLPPVDLRSRQLSSKLCDFVCNAVKASPFVCLSQLHLLLQVTVPIFSHIISQMKIFFPYYKDFLVAVTNDTDPLGS